MPVIKRIVLKYRKPMAIGSQPGHNYVALDKNSGGYPYPVEALRANDFKTVEAAKAYPGSQEFKIMELTIVMSEKEINCADS